MKTKSASRIKSLVILSNHWFDGFNYYHVARVFVNNEFIGSKLDISYSDAAVYQTALEVLQANGYFTENAGKHLSSGIKHDSNDFSDWRLNNHQKIIFDNTEVKRKKDLPDATIGIKRI